jgi:hypothetical protein
MLGELGFVTPATERVAAAWNDDETKRKAFLPRAKLGVVAARDGVARVVRGNQVLGTTKIHERLDEVVFVEEARAVVVWSFHPTGEGCDGYPETHISMIRLPP